MATWLCLGCEALYMAPMDSFGLVPHVCALLYDQATGTWSRRTGHRDENMVQDPDTGTVTIRQAGAGRALISGADVLIGATAAQVAQVRANLPATPPRHPDPPPRLAKVWPGKGTNW